MRLSPRRALPVLPVLALATLALTTACGSTVGLSSGGASTSSSGALADDGLGLEAPSTQAPPTGETAAPAGASSPDAGQPEVAAPDGASSDEGALDAPASGGATSAAASFPATGKGWDQKYVYIGITNQSDVSGVAHSLGLKLDPGNVVADVNAVVKDINAHGGLFGRQVKALIQDNSTVALKADRDGSSQRTCTYFTQDHHIMALVNIASLLDTDTLRQCMKKTQTPLMSVSVEPIDDTVYSSYAPFFFGAIAPSWNTLLPTLMTRLSAQGFWKGWNTSTGAVSTAKPVVGVLYGYTNAQHRIGALLKTAAQSAGYKVAAEYSYGEQEQNLSSAVLKFKAAGVTHVLSDGLAVGQFMINANGQAYKPRYALTSYSGMQAALEDNAPKSQLPGSMGVGWMPTFDTSFAKDPGYVGKGTKQCADIMAKAGIKFQARFAQLVAYAICDGFHMVQDGATQGRTLQPLGVINGLKDIGPNFRQAFSFGSGLSRTSTQMPGAARDIAWDTSCSCFAYKGSTYKL